MNEEISKLQNFYSTIKGNVYKQVKVNKKQLAHCRFARQRESIRHSGLTGRLYAVVVFQP